MEDKPDDGSFRAFKDQAKVLEHQRQIGMGEVSQELAFPSMDSSNIAHPWPVLLHFPPTAAVSSSPSSNNTSGITNPIHLLPPFPPRLSYGYEDLLLPHETSFVSGLYPSTSTASPFGSLHSEFSRMSAQEIMDAKALAASRSHSEAERRRRERINGHLARLRSLLPNTTKTDKASLLAEVIQHVKELKRQTSEIAEESAVPTEADELAVDVVGDDEDGRPIVKASLCCDDRPELLPELIKVLRAMRLRTLKAEIVTLGGRVRNVLLITGKDGVEQPTVGEIQEALRAAMEKAAASGGDEPSTSNSGGSKRQRTGGLSSILENQSI